MVGLRGSGLTQMRGLWRCPERLSYALAVESGMCSGTETVFSTGLWRISVHLDNRVGRSLGWHSVDRPLVHGSGSSVGLSTVTAAFRLEFGVSHEHKRRREYLIDVPPDTTRSAPSEGRGGRSAVWLDHHHEIKRWATGPRVWQSILHLIPVWGTLIATGQLLGSIWWQLKSNPPPLYHTHIHSHTRRTKIKTFLITLRWTKIPHSQQKTHNPAPGHGFSLDEFLKKMYKSSHKAGLYGPKLHKSSSSNVTSCLTAPFHAWWNAKRSVSKALRIKCLLKCLPVILHRWQISAL